MGGSFRIGTIAGIPIRIHVTFLLVLPLLAWLFGRVFRSAAQLAEVPPESLAGPPWLWGLGIAIVLFLGVLIHELAHALYALRTGGTVVDITLLMIGGVSRISEPPRQNRQQALMALAGPVTSLLLGGIFLGLYALLAGTQSFSLRFAVFYVGYLNVVIGIFNLLPAYPMDGGRILRAMLVPRFGPVRATQTAAGVGKFFALLFALLGFLSMNFFLLIIAFFVWLGADSESRQVLVEAALGRIRVRDLMAPRTSSLDARLSVYESGERMLRERRLAFPVVDDGHVVGVLTYEAVQAVPPEHRERVRAGEAARPAPAFTPTDDVWRALRAMDENRVHQLAVVDEGQLVGTITRDQIFRGLQLQELDVTLHPRERAGPDRWQLGPPRESPT